MYIISKYDYFWTFFLIAGIVPILAIGTSRLLAPAKKTFEKTTTYESGIEPIGDSWIQFQIRYYMFALIFVIFDVETLFLYPWALNFQSLGAVAFIDILIFILILIIGLIYAWRKGALEWS